LLSIAVLSQSFTKFFIVVNFNLNRNYIAKNICVKRNIEGNCCQGSCHLKKQMKEDEKSNKPSSSNSKEKFEELFNLYQGAINFYPSTHFIQFENLHFVHHLSTFLFSVFHPPKF
jgi:hypothetical protein